MNKQLIFLYRYLSNPDRRRRWFNPQTLMVVLVSLLFISTLAWAAPRGSSHHDTPLAVVTATPATAMPATSGTTAGTPATAGTATPEETQESISAAVPTPTKTPLPPEYLNNANETIGITFAGSILVLIILIGVATFHPRWNQENK